LGASPIELPRPLKTENELAVRIDGVRFKIMNTRHEPIVVPKLHREGFHDFTMGLIIPPNGMLDLRAKDSRGGALTIQVVRCMEGVAPRRCSTVRHAGELVDRPELLVDLHIERLPLVPMLFVGAENEKPAKQEEIDPGDEG
jgi:hypothetical protein